MRRRQRNLVEQLNFWNDRFDLIPVVSRIVFNSIVPALSRDDVMCLNDHSSGDKGRSVFYQIVLQKAQITKIIIQFNYQFIQKKFKTQNSISF